MITTPIDCALSEGPGFGSRVDVDRDVACTPCSQGQLSSRMHSESPSLLGARSPSSSALFKLYCLNEPKHRRACITEYCYLSEATHARDAGDGWLVAKGVCQRVCTTERASLRKYPAVGASRHLPTPGACGARMVLPTTIPHCGSISSNYISPRPVLLRSGEPRHDASRLFPEHPALRLTVLVCLSPGFAVAGCSPRKNGTLGMYCSCVSFALHIFVRMMLLLKIMPRSYCFTQCSACTDTASGNAFTGSDGLCSTRTALSDCSSAGWHLTPHIIAKLL